MNINLTEKEMQYATIILKGTTKYFIDYNIPRDRALLILERIVEFYKDSMKQTLRRRNMDKKMDNTQFRKMMERETKKNN